MDIEGQCGLFPPNNKRMSLNSVQTLKDNDKYLEGQMRECEIMTKISTSCSHVSSIIEPQTLFSNDQPPHHHLNDPIHSCNSNSFSQSENQTLEQIVSDSKNGIPSLLEEKNRQIKILHQRISKSHKKSEKSSINLKDQTMANQDCNHNSIFSISFAQDCTVKQSEPPILTQILYQGKKVRVRGVANERLSSNSFLQSQQPKKWAERETAKFFKSLQVFGTDFSMIQRLFPSRTPLQIKNKFIKEQKENPLKIEQSLQLNSQKSYQKISKKLDKERATLIQKYPDASDNAEKRVKMFQEEKRRRLLSFESIDSFDIEIAEEIQEFSNLDKKSQNL